MVKHLLSWIDRVDDAAQRGLPRPLFKTLGGGEIFPEEAWRSTDLTSRAKGPDAGDEDGPFSGSEVNPERAEVSDEDPVSEAEPTVHAPLLAWRDRLPS